MTTTNKTEKVFDASKLAAGDVIWFSGYWAKITEIRDHGSYAMVRGVWLVEGSSDVGLDLFAFDPANPVRGWATTRKVSP